MIIRPRGAYLMPIQFRFVNQSKQAALFESTPRLRLLHG